MTFTVLLVEDEKPLLRNLSAMFKNMVTGKGKHCLRILMADSQEIAEALLNDYHYYIDLAVLDIILDIDNPQLKGGLEIAEKIKKSEYYSKPSIIFLSCLEDPGTVIDAFGLGAKEYVTKEKEDDEILVEAMVKPVKDIEKLKTAISRVCGAIEFKYVIEN